MTAPRLTECDFLPAVVVFQVIALGFRADEFAALGHNQNIGVVLDKAVDCKTLTGNISVPPADIRQGGQFHNQLLFQLVHVAILSRIANALMEQEISVRMTNFSAILNDLTASFEGRNEYIERLCRFPLLILDDFGMERGTEYGLEQVYNVIDSRYRSRKPLIVTTNLSLTELQNPQDTAHARIYDRVLEMCLPILFTGENFRKETAQAKLNGLKELLK